jgi:hypothetical protein
MKLSRLMIETGANGVVVYDAGNGSAGPRWVPVDDLTADMLTSEMEPCKPEDNAGRDDDTTLGQIMADVLQEGTIPEYVSDWIVGGDGSNPWRFRIIA